MMFPSKHNMAIRALRSWAMQTAPSTFNRMDCYSQLKHHIGHLGHPEVGSGAAQYPAISFGLSKPSLLHKWTVPCKPGADHQQNAGHAYAMSKWMFAGLQHETVIARNLDVGSCMRYNVAIHTQVVHALKDKAPVRHGLLCKYRA